MSVEIYSVNSPNRDIQTGDMRLVDLHNRKFYITESNSAPNQIQLSLVLAPFTHQHHHQASFGSSDPTLKSKQVLSLTLDQFDDQLNVRFKYNRHRGMGPSYPIDPNAAVLQLQRGPHHHHGAPAAQRRRGGHLHELWPGHARHAQCLGHRPVADGKRPGAKPLADQQHFARRLPGHDHVSGRHEVLREMQRV